jgi:hypothetical protein
VTTLQERVDDARSKWRLFGRDIVTKAATADAEAFDKLPIPDGPDRQALRRKVVLAAIRTHACEDIADERASRPILSLLALPVALGTPLPLFFPGGHTPLTSLVLYAVGSLVGMGAFLGLTMPFTNWSPGMWAARLLLMAIVGIPLGSIALSIVNWSALRAFRPLLLGWDAAMVGVLVVVAWVWSWTSLGTRRTFERCKPLDRLLVRAVHVAATIHSERHRWRARSTAARWCEAIEDLASLAAQTLALSRRAGASNQLLQLELQAEALRIAAVFRSYSKAVVTAAKPEDLAPVVDMLVLAIRALADGDRGTLLANAPQLPAVAAARWRRTAVRLGPSIVLAGAAVALPMIPAITSPTAAANVRWTLLVGAVSALVSNTAVQSRVDFALDKALWR